MLQEALDNELNGLEDEEDDPLEQLAEIMAGMTGFNYTKGDRDMIYEDFQGEGAAASVGALAPAPIDASAPAPTEAPAAASTAAPAGDDGMQY